MVSWSVSTGSPRQTMSWGNRLGKMLEGGEIIALIGELGTGKTCFVRGVAQGLEVGQEAWIRSPSFTLINEYEGRLPIYHIDLYRVETRAQLEGLNLREYFYSDGVSLIEWFEQLPAGEVHSYLEVRFAHLDGNRRQLTFSSQDQCYKELVESLRHKGLKTKKTTV
jgi:tRNA threonylcarbamoyladenosine biosynthesis protein TsaE